MPDKFIGRLMTVVILGVLVTGTYACGRQKVIVELEQTDGDEPISEVSLSPFLETETENGTMMPDAVCVVHICGEVRNPGVYRLAPGSRICDAVDSAGGLTDSAVQEYVNLAAQVADGQQIRIPDREEIERMKEQSGGAVDAAAVYDAASGLMSAGPGGSGGEDDGRVDINHASREQLCTLPGIGEAKAAAIVAYREANGKFSTAEEIMKVDGIKEAGFKKLKDFITVR